jgi:hypothetical protein
MRETVTIHVGQCGNQIGNQFWNNLLMEHENTPDTDDSLSAFFRFAPQRDGRTHAMKARALLIDMECGPLQETMNSPLGSLFDDTQFVMDVYGSGNNFAQGHYFYGPKYRDRFEEGLRKVVEHCDSLQTFLVTHSLGGGTGSGVGTYMLSLLSDIYPKNSRFSTCVYPSVDNDVVTAPYNTILATRQLIEHADCVFPLDNTSMFAFAKLEEAALQRTNKTKYGETEVAATNKPSAKDHGFDAINAIAARMLCHLTSSSRFHGDMNVDMNEIYTNLVPFPQLHFLMTALSVREKILRPTLARRTGASATSSSKGNSSSLLSQQQPRGTSMTKGSTGGSSIRTATNTAGSSGGGGGVSLGGGGSEGERALLQRAFVDVLGARGALSAANPTQSKTCVTVASAFLARGSAVPLADFLGCVTSSKRSMRFPAWNEDACKVREPINQSTN